MAADRIPGYSLPPAGEALRVVPESPPYWRRTYFLTLMIQVFS